MDSNVQPGVGKFGCNWLRQLTGTICPWAGNLTANFLKMSDLPTSCPQPPPPSPRRLNTDRCIINFLFLLLFHPSIPWYSYSSIIWQTACCLSTTTRSGLLCLSWWSVCMLKSQRILTFSNSQNFSRDLFIPLVCNFQSVLSARAPMDTQLLQRHHVYLYILSEPTLSIHKLCGLLILPLSCTTCILSWQPCLSIFAFIALVRNACSWAAVSSPSDSFFNSPFFNHVQERLLVAPCSCSCFLLVVIIRAVFTWPS